MATPLNLELAADHGAGAGRGRLARAAADRRRAPTTTPRWPLPSPPSRPPSPSASASTGSADAIPQRTIGGGLAELTADGPALAIVCVPGPYAVAEAADAIAAGRSVLVFSDGVPVEHEVALKQAAHDGRRAGHGPRLRNGDRLRRRARLRQRRAPRARSGWSPRRGTGAQQVSCLLDMAGVGVSHVLGVGGRDLSEAVGGLATLDALAALDADPATERVMLVSKPPAPSVPRPRSRLRRRPLGAGALRRALGRDARPHRRRRGPARRHGARRAGLAVPARAGRGAGARRRAQGPLLRRHARRRDDAAGRAGARRHPLQHPAAAGARPRDGPVRRRVTSSSTSATTR